MVGTSCGSRYDAIETKIGLTPHLVRGVARVRVRIAQRRHGETASHRSRVEWRPACRFVRTIGKLRMRARGFEPLPKSGCNRRIRQAQAHCVMEPVSELSDRHCRIVSELEPQSGN